MNDNNFNNNVDIQKSAQLGQESAQTEGTNVPQAGTSDNDRMELVKRFHEELQANTLLINQERERYAKNLAGAKSMYDKGTDRARQMAEDIQIERDALNASITAKKAELNQKEKEVRDFRRKIYNDFTDLKTSLKNVHATNNLALQNERHMIFERYHMCGGANLAELSEQLYPEGVRTKKSDGGLDDEE